MAYTVVCSLYVVYFVNDEICSMGFTMNVHGQWLDFLNPCLAAFVLSCLINCSIVCICPKVLIGSYYISRHSEPVDVLDET